MVKKDGWTFDEICTQYKAVAPDRLMHTVAHDIRNQLSTIVGYLELVHLDYGHDQLSEAEKKKFLETALERTHTIGVLLDASIVVDQNQRSGTQE